MAENIGMKLNMAVGRINLVSPNFDPPTFNRYIKNLDQVFNFVNINLIILPMVATFSTKYSHMV